MQELVLRCIAKVCCLEVGLDIFFSCTEARQLRSWKAACSFMVGKALASMRRPHTAVALIRRDEGPGIPAGAGTGVTSNGSQATEMGLVISKQPGTADHGHRGQHKRRAAQHVRPYTRAVVQTAQEWCSLDLQSGLIIQAEAHCRSAGREQHACLHIPGRGATKGIHLKVAKGVLRCSWYTEAPCACRVNPGQGNDAGMLAGGAQTGGLGNADSNAEVAQPPLPPGVARPPAIPGTPAYARQQVDDCLVVR